jgi:hypothetical protein
LFEEASKVMSYRRVVIYHKNSNQAGLPSFYLITLLAFETTRPADSCEACHIFLAKLFLTLQP